MKKLPNEPIVDERPDPKDFREPLPRQWKQYYRRTRRRNLENGPIERQDYPSRCEKLAKVTQAGEKGTECPSREDVRI
jgi:hypothetical protein